MSVSSVFKNLSADGKKLSAYGFKERDGKYIYSKKIFDGQFTILVTVEDGIPSAKVLDDASGEEYTLHLVEGASGEFVGRVRREYEEVLQDIAKQCFYADVFKKQAREILDYAKKAYGCDPEFLWADLPEAAVLRRKDTSKWYAVFMRIPLSRILPGAEGIQDILDVHCDPAEIISKVDGEHYFFGYHMNKKHWLTVVLNAGVPTSQITALLDNSYALAAKK